MLRLTLELIRIIFIFALLGSLFGYLLLQMYSMLGISVDQYSWIAGVAVYIFLFVLYRNKWQFSGWYNGKGKEKLPKAVTNALIAFSILLIILAPMLS